jgi:SAM-dependent methyltransferase
MAADRIGPHGKVLATDSSQAMVEAAEAAIRDAGATNVAARALDAQTIDLPEASFDVVLARLVLMFVDDLPACVASAARVLAPGGRFVAVTWSALSRNPFHAAFIDVARELGPLPEPEPEVVRAFRLEDPSVLRDAFEKGGLREIEVRLVPRERRIPPIAEEIERQKNWPPTSTLFAALDEVTRARAFTEIERRWKLYETPDGALFPSELVVIAGVRT